MYSVMQLIRIEKIIWKRLEGLETMQKEGLFSKRLYQSRPKYLCVN